MRNAAGKEEVIQNNKRARKQVEGTAVERSTEERGTRCRRRQGPPVGRGYRRQECKLVLCLVGRDKRGRMTSTYDICVRGGVKKEENARFSSTTNTTTRGKGEPCCLSNICLATGRCRRRENKVQVQKKESLHRPFPYQNTSLIWQTRC